VPLRPTELGLKGVALVAALEVAFFATSYSNLFFLLLTFCGVIGGIAAVGALANLRGLRVVVEPVPFAAAGSPRQIVVHTRGGRRRFDLALVLEGEDRKVDAGHVAIATGDGTHTATMAALPRGVLHATRLRVSSRHPFGLFQASRRYPVEIEVVTYPSPDAGDAAPRNDVGPSIGAHDRGRVVASLRPFRTGDALGAVHWKATARRGEPVVKECEPEGTERLDVVIDRRCSAEELETRLAAATDFVLNARDGDAPVTLRSQDWTQSVTVNGVGAHTALRRLAAATTLPSTAPGVAAAADAAGAVHV